MPHAHAVHIGEPSYTTIRHAATTLFTTASASRRVQAIKCGFPGSCSSRDRDRATNNRKNARQSPCALKRNYSAVCTENYRPNEFQYRKYKLEQVLIVWPLPYLSIILLHFILKESNLLFQKAKSTKFSNSLYINKMLSYLLFKMLFYQFC